jgi:hypothetical protein
MIWIIDFFDFIFAEENLKTEIQATIISKYNIIDKMALHNHIYNTQLLNPGFDLGRLTIQVHQYRQ